MTTLPWTHRHISLVRTTRETATEHVDIHEVLEGIRTGRWRETVERIRTAIAAGDKEAAKRIKTSELPGILFHGTFHRRKKEGLIQHSGILCLDFDRLNERLEEAREALTADPHTAALFISPSGTGLKLLALAPTDASAHRAAYAAALSHFAKMGLHADTAPRALASLCFVSHDPGLFQRLDPTPFEPAIPAQPSMAAASAAPTLRDAASPSDDFARRTSWDDLLTPQGWQRQHTAADGNTHWTRPGKDGGTSATTKGEDGPLYVFSSNAPPLPPNEGLSKFYVFALYHHRGDMKEAARALAAARYGAERRRSVDVAPNQPPEAPAIEVRAYSTRGWHELARLSLQPRVSLWGDAFALGELGTVFGQGGLGKSRLSLNLARNQVLGLPFADIPTHPTPLRHLIMGSENSIHRLQHDVRRMSAGLADDRLALLDAHIRLATLEHTDDPFISVASTTNIARWQVTLEAFRPDVLWVDPWGDVLDGEANNDEDTRGTLQTLRRLLRHVEPNAALIVLAHSRTGARNIAQAVGLDAANFGKGSKALYSASRCVWNLAPADESESPPIVCFMAKNNNGPRSKPFALKLDPETMLYTRDPDFDFDAWQDMVNQRANGKRPTRGRPPIPLAQYHQHVLEAVSKGPMTSGRLVEHLRQSTGLGEKRVQALLEDCLAADCIAKTPRLKERDGKVLYGTPEQVDAVMRPKLDLP